MSPTLRTEKGFFVTSSSNYNPTLESVREKIVFVKRSSGGWGQGARFDIQNNYLLGTNWQVVGCKEQNGENKSSSEKETKYYVNFLSGSSGSFPYFVASGHSNPCSCAPRLATGLTTPGWRHPRINCFIGICTIAFEGTNILFHDRISGHTGLVLSDFPGKAPIPRACLIQNIIQQNQAIEPNFAFRSQWDTYIRAHVGNRAATLVLQTFIGPFEKFTVVTIAPDTADEVFVTVPIFLFVLKVG